jgi:parallel beta-helix repeat protein
MRLDDASRNTLGGNTITGNSVAGIRLENSGDNLIYNNYFNNWDNTEFGTSVLPNTWNVPQTYGQNIIGCSYLGGNYWARPDGTGWSQVTPVNEFGFTSPLVLAPGNIDYLPLGTYRPEPDYQGYSPGMIRSHRALYDSKFISNTIPPSIYSCASFPVSMIVNNTGSAGWIGPYVGLAAYNDAAKQFSPVRVPLDDGSYVGSEKVQTFTFDLQAPCTPGTYTLQYSMIHGQDIYFGEVLEVIITVEQSNGSFNGTSLTKTRVIQLIPDIDKILAPTQPSAAIMGFREDIHSGGSASIQDTNISSLRSRGITDEMKEKIIALREKSATR